MPLVPIKSCLAFRWWLLRPESSESSKYLQPLILCPSKLQSTRSQINRARGVGSGPIYSAILFQLLLLVRMRLLLAWFRRALVLRSRPCRGLNRPRLWRRSCCGLGPLSSLSRTALRCQPGFSTSMLHRCRLALWPDGSYRPGCGSGFGFSTSMFHRCRLALWPDGSCPPGCGSGFGFSTSMLHRCRLAL
jgi:hypothetical protein